MQENCCAEIDLKGVSSKRYKYEQELAARFLSGGVLIFLHIPRCAGRTLRDIFRRQIGSGKRHRALCEGVKSFVKRPLGERHKANSLRGHTFYGVHKWMREPHVYVTLLREPIERALSFYYWFKQKQNLPFSKAVRELELGEFVSLRLADSYVSNVMTKLLSGAYTQQGAFGVIQGEYALDSITDDNILEIAKANLHNEFIFDLVEKFRDRGEERFGKLLRWRKAKRDADGHINPHPSVEEIDLETIKIIKQKNQMDIALYEYAKDILEGNEQWLAG